MWYVNAIVLSPLQTKLHNLFLTVLMMCTRNISKFINLLLSDLL